MQDRRAARKGVSCRHLERQRRRRAAVRLTPSAALSKSPAVRARLARRRLGDSSTVEQRTLTPLILVRIQVPQPRNLPILLHLRSFHSWRNSADISDACGSIHIGRVTETQNRARWRAKAASVSVALFSSRQMSSVLVGLMWSQTGANPRSRHCSCQSCGRFLESPTSRVDVSSTGCWPTRIARTIAGERYDRRASTAR